MGKPDTRKKQTSSAVERNKCPSLKTKAGLSVNLLSSSSWHRGS